MQRLISRRRPVHAGLHFRVVGYSDGDALHARDEREHEAGGTQSGLAFGAAWQRIGNENENGGSGPAVSR